MTGTLDLSRPVALMLVAVLHFVHDDKQATSAVRQLVRALAPGSYLVISHATADLLSDEVLRRFATTDFPGRSDFTGRTRAQIARFLDGLDIVPPGIEMVSSWRPEPGRTPPPAAHVSAYGAMACKAH